jgi:hypothetical protein
MWLVFISHIIVVISIYKYFWLISLPPLNLPHANELRIGIVDFGVGKKGWWICRVLFGE